DPLDIRKFGILGQFADQIERVCVAFILHRLNKSDSCLIGRFKFACRTCSAVKMRAPTIATVEIRFKIELRSRCIMTDQHLVRDTTLESQLFAVPDRRTSQTPQ